MRIVKYCVDFNTPNVYSRKRMITTVILCMFLAGLVAAFALLCAQCMAESARTRRGFSDLHEAQKRFEKQLEKEDAAARKALQAFSGKTSENRSRNDALSNHTQP